MDMETKREIILDNYDHPFNKVDEELNGYIKVNSANDSCIDNINLYIKIEDNIIKDIKFSGEACAISTASTSIMIKNMIAQIANSIRYTILDSAILAPNQYSGITLPLMDSATISPCITNF